ncbi:amino acid transporter [Lacticaseibacillus paracasei]|uniref:APC family permease n=1 Tax=Lacticaseibacillus paracasei TaxID=1597 RepID=UPI0009A3DBB5|nr:APC family permease [Lacticaseibacillus paracasei]OPH04766.1 amino acid transporter [Lacticaseibacillus paracasei]
MQKRKKLTLLEVFGLSIAMVAPTGAMSFNTASAAANAGINMPIAFLLGGIGVLFVAISFVELGKRIPGDGSAYAYNAKALGEKAGFISGWLLVLTYVTFVFSSGAIVGNFADVFLSHFGIHLPVNLYNIIVLLLGGWLSHKGIEFSTRLTLVLELLAVLVLSVLTVVIIFSGGRSGNSVQPFIPQSHMATGLGMGMVFALMSFAGFEGSATIAPRATHPRKAISIALLGAVSFAAIFYFLVSYAEVIGFGSAHIGDLAKSTAPMNFLATHYLGTNAAIFMDFAAMVSYFACYFGALNAGAFMLEALGKSGYLHPWLAELSGDKQTPTHALDGITGLALIVYAIFAIGLGVSASDMYNWFGTIGMLGLLTVYVLVNIGAIVYFRKDKGRSMFKHVLAPVIGILVLIYPIYTSLWPIPAFPMNTFPYIAIIWFLIGLWVATKRRNVETSLEDF